MSVQMPHLTLEIVRNGAGVSTESSGKVSDELMVVSIMDKRPPQQCGGVLIGNEDISNPIAGCVGPDHFKKIIESGAFSLEIPIESFESDLIAEKLKKLRPEERVRALSKIMNEENIPRVILIIPPHLRNTVLMENC